MNVNTGHVEESRLARLRELKWCAVVQRAGLAAGVIVGLSATSCGSVDFGTPSGGPNDAAVPDAGQLDAKLSAGPTLVQIKHGTQALIGTPASVTVQLDPQPVPGDLLILTVADSAGAVSPTRLTGKGLTWALPPVQSPDYTSAEIWYSVVPDGFDGMLMLSPDPAGGGGSVNDKQYLRMVAMEWRGLATGGDPLDGAGKQSSRITDGSGAGSASLSISPKQSGGLSANDLLLFDVSTDTDTPDFGMPLGWAPIDSAVPTIVAGPESAEQVWYRIGATTADATPTAIVHGTKWDAVVAAFKVGP